MRKFEYKIIYGIKDGVPNEVKTAGLEGWELVSVIPIQEYEIAYYFKREIN